MFARPGANGAGIACKRTGWNGRKSITSVKAGFNGDVICICGSTKRKMDIGQTGAIGSLGNGDSGDGGGLS